MARIPYFDVDKAQGRAKKAYEKLPNLNIFRMLGHSGELVDGFTKLGAQILYFTKLDPILREIAIIRVGVLSKATYEVYQHERIGRQLGMSDALVAAIHEGPEAAAFSEIQKHVMRFTDDVVANVRAGDASWTPLAGRAVASGDAGAHHNDRILHDGVAVSGDIRRRHRGHSLPASTRFRAEVEAERSNRPLTRSGYNPPPIKWATDAPVLASIRRDGLCAGSPSLTEQLRESLRSAEKQGRKSLRRPPDRELDRRLSRARGRSGRIHRFGAGSRASTGCASSSRWRRYSQKEIAQRFATADRLIREPACPTGSMARRTSAPGRSAACRC